MINVLSLFDGISVGKVALDKLGLEINKDYKYYASEIDKTAIKCSEANHVGIIRLGDVHKVSFKDGTLFTENGNFKVGSIDLICGGSPCQSFSPLAVSTGNYKGLKGKSGLFYEYLRILKEIQLENPGVKFLLENVKMAKANKVELDKYLGCEGVLINSSLVSFQNRLRYYWSNVKLTPPEDMDISFQDYKVPEADLTSAELRPKTNSMLKMWADGKGTNSFAGGCANVTHTKKVYCLTTKQYRCPNSGLIEHMGFCRFLTQEEMEQAQTLPVGYTSTLSYGQACEVLGNGWTADVIKHCFKQIMEEINND